MNRIAQLVLGVFLAALVGAGPCWGADSRSFTTTLLLDGFEQEAGAPDDLLWIRRTPPRNATLHFDLSPIPESAQLTRCHLRLVAHDVRFGDRAEKLVILKARLPGQDRSVISLSPLNEDRRIALKGNETLCAALNTARASGRLTLELFTESNRASTLLYSNIEFAGDPSNKPRLVVQYDIPGPPTLVETLSWPQHQGNAQNTGRSRWRPFRTPTGYRIAEVPLPTGHTLAGRSFPLFHGGKMCVVVTTATGAGSVCFDGTRGGKVEGGLPNPVIPPVIGPDGVLYLLADDGLYAYDHVLVDRPRVQVAKYSLENVGPGNKDLTVGADGSIFLTVQANGGGRSVLGLTAKLEPFVKSREQGYAEPPPDFAAVGKVGLAPDGARLFFHTGKGGEVIDVIDPDPSSSKPLSFPVGGHILYAPLAGTGSEMVFSGLFPNGTARLRGYDARANPLWESVVGPLSQPVLGSGLVFFFETGHWSPADLARQQLQALPYAKKGAVKSAIGLPWEGCVKSNVVMDGADNLYFWGSDDQTCEGGTHRLYGFGPNGNPRFDEGSPGGGLPGNLRLALAPDGTVWGASPDGDRLYAFVPLFESPGQSGDLALEASQELTTQTVYRATGELTVGGLTVPAGTNVLLHGGTGLRFRPGFTLKKGAALLAKTGKP